MVDPITNTPKAEAEKDPVTTPKPEENKPIGTMYDKVEAIVAREEVLVKERRELIEREEKLFANQRLAGTAGGHIETAKVDPDKQKVIDAAKYFEGSQLEKDIIKANE